MKFEKATFACGCFWCTEAIFKRLRGVQRVVSGYSGGKMTGPSYEAVSGGATGHAEAIQITFDPKVISYETLLAVFFKLHDPTTLNRQGADVGTQYRSVIFYHDSNQEKIAEKVRAEVEKSGEWKDPIVTEIVPYENFFRAEAYHQDFYETNRLNSLGPHPSPFVVRERTASSAYCQIVIDPKISKLYENFGKIVKKPV